MFVWRVRSRWSCPRMVSHASPTRTGGIFEFSCRCRARQFPPGVPVLIAFIFVEGMCVQLCELLKCLCTHTPVRS